MPNIVNLFPPIPQGDDYSITVTCLQKDGVTPADLTGARSVLFTVKAFDTDVAPLISRDLTTGIQITDAVNGILKITGASSDTVNIKPSLDLRYDVVVIDSAGKRTTYVVGKFPVSSHPRPS